MRPHELLSHAESIGVSITAEDGDLHVKAAVGVLTDGFKETLREYKHELVAHLTRSSEHRKIPLSDEEAQLLLGLPEEQIHAVLQVREVFDGIIEQGDPNESQIDAVDLIREGTMR